MLPDNTPDTVLFPFDAVLHTGNPHTHFLPAPFLLDKKQGLKIRKQWLIPKSKTALAFLSFETFDILYPIYNNEKAPVVIPHRTDSVWKDFSLYTLR